MGMGRPRKCVSQSLQRCLGKATAADPGVKQRNDKLLEGIAVLYTTLVSKMGDPAAVRAVFWILLSWKCASLVRPSAETLSRDKCESFLNRKDVTLF
jgi:hypothetical protein